MSRALQVYYSAFDDVFQKLPEAVRNRIETEIDDMGRRSGKNAGSGEREQADECRRMSTRWRSRLRLIGDQRSAIGEECGVAASASKPTEFHTLTRSVRAKSSQRATAIPRHRGVPLSRPVEEYFDRLAPAAGQHDSEAFFAQ